MSTPLDAEEVPAVRVRSADTRFRVLDATIDLLVERGYAGTSTRLVASRAGVSQGAVQHHFRSRSDLCVSAMSLLVQRLSREFIDATPAVGDPIERIVAIVDRLLAVFSGPSFAAGLELRLAARTDLELRTALRGLDRELDRALEDGATEMLPELAGLKGFEDLLELTMASLRGAGLLSIDPDRDLEPIWSSVRGQLVDAVRRLEVPN
jgi:AcrR family transcriptional regulator